MKSRLIGAAKVCECLERLSRRDLGAVIEAFLEIDSDLPLVIVGRKAWMW